MHRPCHENGEIGSAALFGGGLNLNAAGHHRRGKLHDIGANGVARKSEDVVEGRCLGFAPGKRLAARAEKLSDGGDNGSDATLAETIEKAQRVETLIYAILYTDGGYGSGEGRHIMERLGKETGGSYFEVSKKLPIDQVYALIQEDLRSQYSIGYVSDKPPQLTELRKLQLTVKRPGLVVQTRDRYWTGPPLAADTK